MPAVACLSRAIALVIALLPGQSAAVECIVNAHSTARVGASSNGVLATVAVDRGDSVPEGQVLAELESSAEQSRVALARMEAENDLPLEIARRKAEAARLKAGRLERLRDRRLVTETEAEEAVLEAATAALELKQAEHEQTRARVELAAAEGALERTRIRAPFDGVVTARLLSPGELYAEEPVLVIARIDPLHVETYLPVARHAGIALGMAVEVTMEDGRSATGHISVIDPVLDAATGTFGVRIEVPNPGGTHLVGQRCDAAL